MFSWMISKKRAGGSQKAAAAEAANLLETAGPSGIKPSGTLKICLEEENELKTAGLSIDEAEENEDAKFARLLHEEYWKSMKQKKDLYHPEALVLINNCNVISRDLMDKYGDMDDCISTTDVAELAASLDEKVKNDLPLPGQVELINGGPPYGGVLSCFSSDMNRFNPSA